MTPATSTQNDPPKEDPETIFARANLALARSQRLVASWLPTPTADELAITPSEEELQRQEDEMFVAVPEKYVVTLCLILLFLSSFAVPLEGVLGWCELIVLYECQTRTRSSDPIFFECWATADGRIVGIGI